VLQAKLLELPPLRDRPAISNVIEAKKTDLSDEKDQGDLEMKRRTWRMCQPEYPLMESTKRKGDGWETVLKVTEE
jgi:hypothetical protein